MQIYKRLYVGESVNNPDKTLQKLKKGSRLLRAYVIILARNQDQLEIHHAPYLAQKYYRLHPPYVIGIAGTYDEAIDIIVRITEECYASRGDCKLKDYICANEQL